MSKFVDDLIRQVKNSPDLFSAVDESTIKSSLVYLHAWNAEWLPIVDLKIYGVDMRLTYWDKVRLYRLLAWWFKQARLNHLIKG